MTKNKVFKFKNYFLDKKLQKSSKKQEISVYQIGKKNYKNKVCSNGI